MNYEDSILDKFIINRVSSIEKLNEMKEQGLLQPNQIYLVDGESEIIDLKADKNAGNLSDEDTSSWKNKLGYHNIEVIYDMGSSDSNLNWGYTSGLRGGSSHNKDFTKYKKLLITFYSYNGNVGTMIVDLVSSKDKRSWLYTATRVDGTTYTQIYPISYSLTDKMLYIGTIYENSTNQNNTTNFGVSKIEGVY